MMLTFDDDISTTLKKACDHDSDQDAMHFVRAAKVVYTERCLKVASHLMGHSASVIMYRSFCWLLWTWICTAQISSITAPTTWKQPHLFSSFSFQQREACKRCRCCYYSSPFMSVGNTPSTVYCYEDSCCHMHTKGILSTPFFIGVCVFLITGFLKAISDISNGVCQKFTVDGVVCPTKMRRKVFSTAIQSWQI